MISRSFLAPIVFLAALHQSAVAQYSPSISLGSKFAGNVEAQGTADAFTFAAVKDTALTISVKGQSGFAPALTLQDISTGKTLATIGNGESSLSIKKLPLPSTGIYRVIVTGNDGQSIGSYTGSLLGKVPSPAKTVATTPQSGPFSLGDPLTFTAVAGARLSGKVTAVGGQPTLSPWIGLSGPTGPIDVLDHLKVKKQGKVLVLDDVALPVTGTYALVTIDELIDASAKLHVTFPSGFKGVYNIPDSKPAPIVDPVPTLTKNTSILLTGTALFAGSSVRVDGGLVPATTISGTDHRFAIPVSLKLNSVNKLFVSELNQANVATPPVPVTVTHDSTGPQIFVDFPPDGDVVTTPTVTIAGRIADALTGFMGLQVNINGMPASVDPGVGTNGTYEAVGIPLTPGVNDIVATATDVLGNLSTVSSTVVMVPTGADRIESTSGGGQIGTVVESLADPLVAVVRDSKGKALAGKLVTFEVIRSDGGLAKDKKGKPSPRLQIYTDSNGRAQVFYRLGHDSGCGNNRVRATATGVPGTAYFCATATPAAALKLNVGSGDRQTAEAGATLPEPLRVWVNDGRNGCHGESVIFEVTRGEGYLVDASGASGTKLTIESAATGSASVRFVLGLGTSVQEVRGRMDPSDPGVTFTAYAVLPTADPQPTRFHGVVLDNSQSPIGNVTCRLKIGVSEWSALTDAAGQFRLDGISGAGPAHLVIDGGTANSVGGAPFPQQVGDAFPGLAYEAMVISGADNALATPIFLPLINKNGPNAAVFDGTQDVVLELPGVEGLRFRFRAAPGSHHLDPSGNPVSPSNPLLVSVHQVRTSNIPMPVPDGASAPFAWTLQPAGAHFDPPVEVTYPNLEGLPPGSITYFLSFDHDTGRFEIVSSGHVVEDGSVSVTDPGDGIATSGWGCQCPPYPPVGDCEYDCTEAAEFLQGKYEDKVAANSGSSALAHQIACLADTVCNGTDLPPNIEPCLPDSPIPDIINDFAETSEFGLVPPNLIELLVLPWTEAGAVIELACATLPGSWAVPDWIPGQLNGQFSVNDLCSTWEGLGGHFPYQLVPGFWKYADQLKPNSVGRACHDKFLDQIVPSCFDKVEEFNPLAKAIAKKLVPTLAKLTRNSVVALWCALHGGAQALAATPPAAIIAVPDPALLFDPTTDSIGDLRVRQANDDFYLTVGQPIQIKVTTAGGTLDLTAASTGTEYLPLALGNTATITPDGLLTVNSTASPLAAMPLVLYVVVRNNGKVGFGQFGVLGADSDGDMIADHFEQKVGLDPFTANSLSADKDGDGLRDIEECLIGVQPGLADSDGDGISDGEEVAIDSDPRSKLVTVPKVDRSALVTIAGQTVKAEAGGNFRVTSIPVNGEPARAEAIMLKKGIDGSSRTFYVRSKFFESIQNQVFKLDAVEVSSTPFPSVTKLSLSACVGGPQVLTATGASLKLCARATLSNSQVADVSSFELGTTFKSSNTAVATVDKTGQVTAGEKNGSAVITARHLGFTATTVVIVSLGDPGTTVVGRVLTPDGNPAVGAMLTLLGVPAGNSGAGGKFSLSAAAEAGPIVVAATMGNQTNSSLPIDPIPDGITDLGDIVFDIGACQFDPVLGVRLPGLIADDDSVFFPFAHGFSFPYGEELYTALHINTNGNLTFAYGDPEFLPLIPSGVINGSPRIAINFMDLDPSQINLKDKTQGVFAKELPDRLIVTWSRIPEYATASENTAQLTLHSDGRAQYVYHGMASKGASSTITVAQSLGGNPTPLPVKFTSQPTFSTADGTLAAFESFNANSQFDLDFKCLTFAPNGLGGFDVFSGNAGTKSLPSSSWIVGQVVDVDHRPLANARVSFTTNAGLTRVVNTTLGGYFALSDVPGGEALELRVTAPGFSPAIRKLRLDPGASWTQSDFTLSPMRIWRRKS